MKGRRSDCRRDPSNHRRSRHSRSPLVSDKRQNRAQKRPYSSSGRRNESGERLQDHPLRRSDHGKELVEEHSLPFRHWSHQPNRSLSPRDDDFRFPQNREISDHALSNPSWRISKSCKNGEFYSQIDEALPSSYRDVERHHIMPQKATFVGEGPSRELYSDQPMDSALFNLDRLRTSGPNVGMGIQDSMIYSHKDGYRDPYDGSIGRGIQENGIYSRKDELKDPYDCGIHMEIQDNGAYSRKDGHRDPYDDSFGMGIDNVVYSHKDGHRDPYDGSVGMRIQHNDIHSYDRHTDQYGDLDKKQVYSKDLSFPKPPPSHMKTFISAPSSSILKEGFAGLPHDKILDEFAPGIYRYPNESLEHHSYHKTLPSDTLRHELPNESFGYGYDELHRRGFDERKQRTQDELYKKIPHPSRLKVTSSTMLKYNEDSMNKADSSNGNFNERTFSDHQDSLYGDFSRDYHDVGAQQKLQTNPDNWHGSLRVKSSRDFETMPIEESFTHEREYFPIPYRADHNDGRSLLMDHDLDEQRLIFRTQNRSNIDDLSNRNIERTGRRNYAVGGGIDESDSGFAFVNDRRSSSPYGSKGKRLNEEPVGLSLSKSMFSVHSRYRKFFRSKSPSDAFKPSRAAASMHAENDHKINLRRRLKNIHSDFHSASSSERRPDLLRPHKYWKRGMQERLGAQGGESRECANFGKNDPPEDSEEFKQQVHKAFLRYSKLLNESPHNHRIYQNQGNSYSVLCSVCGSSSKEFMNTNSLVVHTYNSHKAGLKTEHLGFHKALCVLLGWNWRVPPDNSRAYQSMPVSEANDMREDLILWPPLVIIQSLNRGSSTKDAKVITIEGLEKMLRDMGFAAGMARVSLGKSASHSIFTVKFMPTFSGLQQAQRLHNHFSEEKHGKPEFQQTGSSGKAEEEDGGVLYGYMAVAEDLDKVDHETKKRSVVKSKKDIQAIADAPLNAE